MTDDKKFEDAMRFRERLFQLIHDSDLETLAVNWAVCSTAANLLAVHPRFDEAKELFITHIVQEADLLKETSGSVFERETVN